VRLGIHRDSRTFADYHACTMPYAPDLANTGAVKDVGYLWSRHSFSKGRVENLVLERLVAIAEKPLYYACGFHKCNLGFCGATEGLRDQPKFRYRGRTLTLGSSEILVPDDEAVYRAPNLILHYIRHHRYRPPECFCAAVLKCPAPDTEEYRERIRRVAPTLPL
jgi:hypothetical protein